MVIKKVDKKNKFISIFNTETGFYVRSGIIENGKDTNVDPFMAEFPELIDVRYNADIVSMANQDCVLNQVYNVIKMD